MQDELSGKRKEFSSRRCQQCDYRNISVPMDKKKAVCPWRKRLACDVYLSTERLKDRVKYLNGKCGPLFIDGEESTIDTFMQQLPADADANDIKRRAALINQLSFFDD